LVTLWTTRPVMRRQCERWKTLTGEKIWKDGAFHEIDVELIKIIGRGTLEGLHPTTTMTKRIRS